jgi:hypothetical protein
MRRMLSFATAAALVLAGQIHAETPNFTGGQMPAMSLLQRAPMFSGANWWSRYGEPVNAVAMSQADSSPSDKNGYGGSVPMHGDGYVFAPGSCDCSPPCIADLWAGYVQNPLRCRHGHCHRHCGCGHCGAACGPFNRCGIACGVSCSAPSCAAPTCSQPVSCTASVLDCGCKPVCGRCRHFHVGERWRGFRAHWHSGCDSCSAPLGCGCTTPAGPMPGGAEKQALQGPPRPLPEEAALFPLPRLN